MSLESVVGNARIKRIIGKALAGKRFPNSVLFFGPEGAGKKAMALEVAKALNCDRSEVDSCGLCPACQAIRKQEENGAKSAEKKGIFPDVMVISPLKNVIKVEQIRMLKKSAHLRPMVGRKRVYIIDEADKMNTEAANSLLKVLEEPPVFTHIFLLTSNPYLILPTIRSRCQNFHFSPILRREIERDLIGRGHPEEQARVIARIVGGNLRKARELDWDEVHVNRKKAWNLLRALWGLTPASPHLQSLFASRGAAARIQLADTLELMAVFLRDLILLYEGGEPTSLMNPDFETPLQEWAGDLNLDQALDFLRRIDYALYALKKNCNLNLLVSSFSSHVLEWNYA